MPDTTYDTLEMGPCTVTYKSTDLGLTQGGVQVDFATEVSTIMADQFGSTAIDNVIQGRSVKVKVPMAERDLDKLGAVIPASSIVTDGTDPTNKKLVIKAGVGTSLRDSAGPLVLHPKDRDVGDKSRDVVVSLATAKGDMSFAYKSDTQRVYEVEFEGYVDLTTDELVTLGDPAVAAA